MKKLLYENVHDIVLDKLFLNLPGFVPDQRVALKLEGLNPAGSIKLKTAVRLVRSAEDAGLLPGCHLIESTSATSASRWPSCARPRATTSPSSPIRT
jgi:N-(2-amino-2-carboxyethyl)-L-glutamate synthase